MNSNKIFYDQFFSDGHHQAWRDAPGKVVVLSYVINHLDDKQKLIDIGCGDGYFLDRIILETINQGKVMSGYGVDISEEAVSLAINEYPSYKFETMDAESMSFDSEKFDWVTSYGVFEHLQEPANAINEVYRVLKKGGRFALMMPTIGYYNDERSDEGWYEDMNKPPQMQWNYTRESWERIFKEAGLILEPMKNAAQHGAIKTGNFYFGSKSS